MIPGFYESQTFYGCLAMLCGLSLLLIMLTMWIDSVEIALSGEE